jgi:hypothetical protein
MNSIIESPIFANSVFLKTNRGKNTFGITDIQSVNHKTVQVGILYSSTYDISMAEKFLTEWLSQDSNQRIAVFQSLSHPNTQISISNFDLSNELKEQFILKALVYNFFNFLDESYSSVFMDV